MYILVFDCDIMLSDVIDILWKERLNNVGQKCHQYHLTEKKDFDIWHFKFHNKTRAMLKIYYIQE
jgi:hypothetical protein